MRYRRLGRSGLKVSAISLGSWQTFGLTIDQDTTEACMVAGYEAGISFFDGAEAYGNGAAETAMGKVLRKRAWRRDTLVISSKVAQIGPHPNQRGLNRKHIVEACDAALERLGVSYLDLFFCHRPDADSPMEETVRAMHELIQRGKIFYWGTSNFTGAEVMEAIAIARQHGLTPPTMDQPIYNLFDRKNVEQELRIPIERFGYGTTVFSPLDVGILTGKYNDGIPPGSRMALHKEDWMQRKLTEDKLVKVRKLSVIATDLGMPMSHLALAWCLTNPAVSTVITGASRPEQVLDNTKASEAADRLDAGVLARIEAVLK